MHWKEGCFEKRPPTASSPLRPGCRRAAEGAHGPPGAQGPRRSDLPDRERGSRLRLPNPRPGARAKRSGRTGPDTGRRLAASRALRGALHAHPGQRGRDRLWGAGEPGPSSHLGLDFAPPGSVATAGGQAPLRSCKPERCSLSPVAHLRPSAARSRGLPAPPHLRPEEVLAALRS